MFDKRANDEKKVEYLELVYDLIFVYLIGRNSSFLYHLKDGFIRPELFLTYVLCTLIIIQIWSYTTFYINRYGTNGVREHVGLFINMYLLYYMADGTRTDWRQYYYRYNTAWLLILLNIALLYYAKLREQKEGTPQEKLQIRHTMGILLIQAAIVAASLPVYKVTGLPLAPVGMVFGILATALSVKINRMVTVDFMHLTERAMLYVVFTFGEMIIAISGYFRGDFGFNTLYFSLMAFLIVVALFLSYGFLYDKMIDREMSTDGTAYMMIHVVLIFALSNITVALEFMQEPLVYVLPKTIYIVCSIMLYYISLLMAARYCKQCFRPTRKWLASLTCLFITFAVLMLVFRQQMYVNIAITVIFVYAVYRYLYRFRMGGF